MKALIKRVNPQTAAGPSGLRYSHLQAALCDDVVEEMAEFAKQDSAASILDIAHECQTVCFGAKGEAGRVRRRSLKGYWRRFLP